MAFEFVADAVLGFRALFALQFARRKFHNLHDLVAIVELLMESEQLFDVKDLRVFLFLTGCLAELLK